MPFSSAELRDVEFVNDIALYLHGDLDNLYQVEMTLSTFYKASSAYYWLE